MCEFTAHIRENGDETEVQTVLEHCTGTAKRAEEYGKLVGCAGIVRLLGYLHDMGKCCRDFNEYIHGTNNMEKGSIDHCYAGARHIVELAKQTGDNGLRETAAFTARVIMSHHGLCDWLNEEGDSYYKNRLDKEERYQEIVDNYESLIPDVRLFELLKVASEEYIRVRAHLTRMASDDKVKFAFYMGQFERLMLSVLVDADRTDTACFMSGREIEQRYAADIWAVFCERMNNKCFEFAKQTDNISKLRCSISDRCAEFAHHEVGVCRLIVPTGGGKTFSSLRFALNYCNEHGREKIFYIAPYMSVLEQNSDSIKSIVGDEYVLEHHSDALADIDDSDELTEYELRTEQWDMPIIATTMVQFLNTFFSGKMSTVRRMHRLCNSVIIIDEVQSVPTKCIHLFNLALNFISKMCNACVVLCSATQPAFERVKHGLVIDEEESMTGDYIPDFKTLQRNQIIPLLRQSGYSYSEAARFCMDRYHEEGSVLMVVNTKVAAANICMQIREGECDVNIIHLSTSMCPEHRRDKIGELKKLLDDNQNVICVTTQLIEAGVDISFPCVIRSLAGLDHVAQVSGRCNRNGEFDKCCNVYLINICDEKLGNLVEIGTGQDIAVQMITSGAYENLQAVPTMTDYFRKLYDVEKGKLDYPVEDACLKTSILDLLSLDSSRWIQRKHKNSFSSKVQAFKTAGKKFKVIEENTQPVIAPYNDEAKQLIEQLHSKHTPYETMQLLRKSQKYVVGLYPSFVRKLPSNALDSMGCGAIALADEFYDGELGVLKEGKPMELLLFG